MNAKAESLKGIHHRRLKRALRKVSGFRAVHDLEATDSERLDTAAPGMADDEGHEAREPGW